MGGLHIIYSRHYTSKNKSKNKTYCMNNLQEFEKEMNNIINGDALTFHYPM